MYSQNPNFDLPTSLKVKPTNSKRWHQHWWGRLIIIFLAIFFILLTAVVFYVSKVVILLRSGQVTPQALFGSNFSSSGSVPEQTLFSSDDPSLGPKEAKVVIVEFGDFQCPACLQAHPVIKELLKDYGSQVLLVWQDFPLADDHPQAVLAAVAAHCAGDQGKFWEMHDELFANQNQITEDELVTIVNQLGINVLVFRDCLVSGKYLKEIEEDFRLGYELGIRSTPTFFINGKMLAGAIPLNIFEQIIVAELSR